MSKFLTYDRTTDWKACGNLKNPLDELNKMLMLTNDELKSLKLMYETLGIQGFIME